MKNIIAAIHLTLATMLIATGCSASTSAGPQTAAKDAFEQWTQTTGTPYKDVTYSMVNNDGTFATVRVTAWMRQSRESDWREHQAEVECRKVGGKWQASPYLDFTFTPAEQDRQREATATAESKEREAKEKLLDSVSLWVARQGHVFSTGQAWFNVGVENSDSKDHTVHMRFYCGKPGGDKYQPSPGPAEKTLSVSANEVIEFEVVFDFSDTEDLNELLPGQPVECDVEVLDVY